jgi:hypothetical protein
LSPLFSVGFNKAVQQHVYTHAAVSDGGVVVTRDHWPFLSDVFEDFDNVTRAALWEETVDLVEDLRRILAESTRRPAR